MVGVLHEDEDEDEEEGDSATIAGWWSAASVAQIDRIERVRVMGRTNFESAIALLGDEKSGVLVFGEGEVKGRFFVEVKKQGVGISLVNDKNNWGMMRCAENQRRRWKRR
ncbi:hypothetical protein V6N13_014741 [Hibiscus sabdariffa]|uniref:Uncharacterized protein n=1 Tax=Hibiscus sabdariffa TaxID=183260 RepID=A0ABR2RX27_9ROSI